MSVMMVKSYNKDGMEIKTKDVILNNENVYKILKKHICVPLEKQKTTKILVKV